jgi:hypothetical protein
MLRSVNATRLDWLPVVLLLAGGPACRREREPAARATTPDTATDAAPTADAPDGGTANAAAGDEVVREESARFMPEPYQDLWIGEPLNEFRAGYPGSRPYEAKADPERLLWQELQEPDGLIVRLGFGNAELPLGRRLRSVQFMSLLQAPVGPNAPTTVQTVEAWRQWLTRAYAPHLAALRDKYGEKADVYSCAGASEHPIVRIVWRGEALAVTVAFMMHDKGLSSTLMVTPLDTAERYIRATQCQWIQDRVL